MCYNFGTHYCKCGGRVRHHIKRCIGNNNNGILLVGYRGAKWLGGRLLSGCKEVKYLMMPVSSVRKGQVQGMSVHGDTDDLQKFISNHSIEKVKGIF